MSSPGKEKIVMEGDSYCCSYCDKEFKSYYDLGSHNWDEHAEIMFGGRHLRSSASRNSLRRNTSRHYGSKGDMTIDRKPIVVALMSSDNQAHGSTSLGKRPRITYESSGSEDETKEMIALDLNDEVKMEKDDVSSISSKGKDIAIDENENGE